MSGASLLMVVEPVGVRMFGVVVAVVVCPEVKAHQSEEVALLLRVEEGKHMFHVRVGFGRSDVVSWTTLTCFRVEVVLGIQIAMFSAVFGNSMTNGNMPGQEVVATRLFADIRRQPTVPRLVTFRLFVTVALEVELFVKVAFVLEVLSEVEVPKLGFLLPVSRSVPVPAPEEVAREIRSFVEETVCAGPGLPLMVVVVFWGGVAQAMVALAVRELTNCPPAQFWVALPPNCGEILTFVPEGAETPMPGVLVIETTPELPSVMLSEEVVMVIPAVLLTLTLLVLIPPSEVIGVPAGKALFRFVSDVFTFVRNVLKVSVEFVRRMVAAELMPKAPSKTPNAIPTATRYCLMPSFML